LQKFLEEAIVASPAISTTNFFVPRCKTRLVQYFRDVVQSQRSNFVTYLNCKESSHHTSICETHREDTSAHYIQSTSPSSAVCRHFASACSQIPHVHDGADCHHTGSWIMNSDCWMNLSRELG
jgi:hypothetical protein